MIKIEKSKKTQATLKIPIMFQEVNTYQVEDTRFIPVKIWLMHTGDNYNGCIFTKEAVTEAIPTLANTPILAFIKTNSQGESDFSDHRIVIERKDGKYTRKYIGSSIGVIPETNNARWEYRLCDDGVEREYLVVDGLVWTKWDEPIDIFSRDIIKNQSMELDEDYLEGYEDEDGYFNITKFRFFGSCVLGIDYHPAMHNSTIEAKFSLDSFKEEIQTKMEQFKLFMTQNQSDKSVDIIKKGGNEELNVGQINAILKEFSLKLSDVNFEINDDITEDDFKSLLTEFVEKQKKHVEFSTTYHQKLEALTNVCEPILIKDSEGCVVSKTYLYICDFDDKYVFVKRNVWNYKGDEYSEFGRFEYSFNDSDNTAKLISEFEEMVVRWLTLEENAKLEASRVTFEALQNEFEQYKKDYSTPNKKVEELTEFMDKKLKDERQNAEQTIFEQFDPQLKDVDEYAKLKEKASEYEIEALEKECFSILGRKAVNFALNINAKNKNQIKVPIDSMQTVEDEYGGLYAKYGKKPINKE